jgi:DNA replication protein DnaC
MFMPSNKGGNMMEQVKQKFKELRLKNCAIHLADVMESAASENLSPLQAIDRLLDLELDARQKARIELRYNQSKLAEKPTIDQFDFNYHESRKKQRNAILHLMDLEFINQHKDVIIIGNPGVGKSFLAKCIAYSATQSGIKTLFTTTMEMINQLMAEPPHLLAKKLAYYQSQDLLVCDELGYLPLGRQGSNLFFQVISARHEKKSTVITTNLPFAKWGDIFDGTTVATAIADRLVYNSEILILEGKSYRKRIKSG